MRGKDLAGMATVATAVAVLGGIVLWMALAGRGPAKKKDSRGAKRSAKIKVVAAEQSDNQRALSRDAAVPCADDHGVKFGLDRHSHPDVLALLTARKTTGPGGISQIPLNIHPNNPLPFLQISHPASKSKTPVNTPTASQQPTSVPESGSFGATIRTKDCSPAVQSHLESMCPSPSPTVRYPLDIYDAQKYTSSVASYSHIVDVYPFEMPYIAHNAATPSLVNKKESNSSIKTLDSGVAVSPAGNAINPIQKVNSHTKSSPITNSNVFKSPALSKSAVDEQKYQLSRHEVEYGNLAHISASIMKEISSFPYTFIASKSYQTGNDALSEPEGRKSEDNLASEVVSASSLHPRAFRDLENVKPQISSQCEPSSIISTSISILQNPHIQQILSPPVSPAPQNSVICTPNLIHKNDAVLDAGLLTPPNGMDDVKCSEKHVQYAEMFEGAEELKEQCIDCLDTGKVDAITSGTALAADSGFEKKVSSSSKELATKSLNIENNVRHCLIFKTDLHATAKEFVPEAASSSILKTTDLHVDAKEFIPSATMASVGNKTNLHIHAQEFVPFGQSCLQTEAQESVPPSNSYDPSTAAHYSSYDIPTAPVSYTYPELPIVSDQTLYIPDFSTHLQPVYSDTPTPIVNSIEPLFTPYVPEYPAMTIPETSAEYMAPSVDGYGFELYNPYAIDVPTIAADASEENSVELRSGSFHGAFEEDYDFGNVLNCGEFGYVNLLNSDRVLNGRVGDRRRDGGSGNRVRGMRNFEVEVGSSSGSTGGVGRVGGRGSGRRSGGGQKRGKLLQGNQQQRKNMEVYTFDNESFPPLAGGGLECKSERVEKGEAMAVAYKTPVGISGQKSDTAADAVMTALATRSDIERCPNGHKCGFINDGCLLYHPTEPCKYMPNCRYGSLCLYIH